MNKEEKLKNILEELQDAVVYPKVWFPTMDGTDEEEMANDKYLEVDKCKILLDYIKNLEQENKQLKDNWNKLKEEIQRLLNRQYDIDKFAEEHGLATYNPVKLNIEHIRNKMQELEKGDK